MFGRNSLVSGQYFFALYAQGFFMNHLINGIALPNEEGFFGNYGGQFIPPDLKQAMDDINVAYQEIRQTAEF